MHACIYTCTCIVFLTTVMIINDVGLIYIPPRLFKPQWVTCIPVYIYLILIFNTTGTHSTDEIQVWYTKQLILFHWSTAQPMKSQKTQWHRPPNFTFSDTFTVSETFRDIKPFIRVIQSRLKSLICTNTYNCAVYLYILSQ